ICFLAANLGTVAHAIAIDWMAIAMSVSGLRAFFPDDLRVAVVRSLQKDLVQSLHRNQTASRVACRVRQKRGRLWTKESLRPRQEANTASAACRRLDFRSRRTSRIPALLTLRSGLLRHSFHGRLPFQLVRLSLEDDGRARLRPSQRSIAKM